MWIMCNQSRVTGIGLDISLVQNELLFSTIFIQKLHGGVVVKPSCCNAFIALGFRGIWCSIQNHWFWDHPASCSQDQSVYRLWKELVWETQNFIPLRQVSTQRLFPEEKKYIFLRGRWDFFRSILISVLTSCQMFLIKWSRTNKNR